MKLNMVHLSQLINRATLLFAVSGAALFALATYQSLQVPRFVVTDFNASELSALRLFFYDTVINSAAIIFLSIGLLIELLRHKNILAYLGLFLLFCIMVVSVGFALEALPFFHNIEESELLVTEYTLNLYLGILFVLYGLECAVFLKATGNKAVHPLIISLALFFAMAFVALGTLMPHWSKF